MVVLCLLDIQVTSEPVDFSFPTRLIFTLVFTESENPEVSKLDTIFLLRIYPCYEIIIYYSFDNLTYYSLDRWRYGLFLVPRYALQYIKISRSNQIKQSNLHPFKSSEYIKSCIPVSLYEYKVNFAKRN